MIVLRIFGSVLIVFGLIVCLTIVGIPIGVGAMLLGLLFIVVSLLGRKRSPIIIQVSHDQVPKT
jgi:hypothetical protein